MEQAGRGTAGDRADNRVLAGDGSARPLPVVRPWRARFVAATSGGPWPRVTFPGAIEQLRTPAPSSRGPERKMPQVERREAARIANGARAARGRRLRRPAGASGGCVPVVEGTPRRSRKRIAPVGAPLPRIFCAGAARESGKRLRRARAFQTTGPYLRARRRAQRAQRVKSATAAQENRARDSRTSLRGAKRRSNPRVVTKKIRREIASLRSQ
jgi:hypothetical protein